MGDGSSKSTYEERCEIANKMGHLLTAQGFNVRMGRPGTRSNRADVCIVGPAVIPLTAKAKSAIDAIFDEWGTTLEQRDWEDDEAGSASPKA